MKNRRALKHLLLNVFYFAYFCDHTFMIVTEKDKVATEFDSIFKKYPDALQCLNWLKDLQDQHMDAKYFVSRYLSFNYDENAPQLDVIEYIKPPRKTKLQKENYSDEVKRMNKAHWTVTLGDASNGHLRAINHKFETWENIKMTAEMDNILQLSELATKPPQNLFVGTRAHDLGSILLTRDVGDSEESESEESS